MKSLLICLLLLFGAFSPTFSCSCHETTLEENFKLSEAVFVGKVVNIKPLEGSKCMDVIVEFEVSRVYKGNIKEKVEVVTAYQPSACGFDFNVCNEYLVFSYLKEGNLRTSTCTHTMNAVISYAAEQQIKSNFKSN